MCFVFVGERPSPKAACIGATWQNGRMAACTLHRALEEAGVDPAAQQFVNLWREAGLGDPKSPPDAATLSHLRRLAERRETRIIAMGRLVQTALTDAGIPHTPMVHPAARGRIRKRERYIAHVCDTLFAAAPC